jgi:ATP-dependent DNA ligase
VTPADPTEWRPQKCGRWKRPLNEAIVEPQWAGVRILAHFADGRTRFIDEDGEDCTDEFAEVAAAVTASAEAGDLVLDGNLTVHPTQADTLSPDPGVRTPTMGATLTQFVAGDRLARQLTPKHRLDPETPIAFVAVDLLRIDGQSLLDVPQLERKRLLESALRSTEIVRVTPFVRHPIGSFLSTWRGMGFEGLVYKAANGRYRPNTRNDDWAYFPMPIR